jgi:hypothetical protein
MNSSLRGAETLKVLNKAAITYYHDSLKYLRDKAFTKVFISVSKFLFIIYFVMLEPRFGASHILGKTLPLNYTPPALNSFNCAISTPSALWHPSPTY